MKLLTALAVLTLGATVALAQSQWMIDPFGANTTSSGRAIVYDNVTGTVIVGGQSGIGIVWDNVGNGTRQVISSDNAPATVITGLGVRTTPGGPQLVAHGLTTSGQTLWTSMDGGVTWGPKLRFTNTYQPFSSGPANTLGTSTIIDPDGTSKFYYGFPWGSGSSRQLEMVTGSAGLTAPYYTPTVTPVQASTVSDEGSVRGVSGASASGLALGVGKRGANAYHVTSAGAKGNINTLNGTAGEAWAISNDGLKIFGYGSVTDGRTGLYPWMNTGFVSGGVNLGTATELPGLAGASGYANNGVVYGASADGHYAVGMSYAGTEKAVLWDTVAMTVLDLTQYASDKGILDDFTRFSRAYSVFDNGYAAGGQLYITGEGAWSPDGGTTFFTRGFVIMIPEPSTFALAGLGLALLIFRRRS